MVLTNFILCFLVCVSSRASGVPPAQKKSSPPRNEARAALESAQSLAKQERWPEAIELYRRALTVSPRNEAAEIGLSDAYQGVHNYEEARSILQRARRQYPKSITVLGAVGSLEVEAESYDAAIEALRSAVVLAPDDVKLRNLLGSAYLTKGDSAAALQPFQPDFLYVLGVIAAQQGKQDEALAAFEKVTQIDPKEADTFFEFGKIRLQKGDREGARAAFRKASELDPSDVDYKRAFAGTSAPEESRKKN
jgi:Flp pilus assembly protein TadD